MLWDAGVLDYRGTGQIGARQPRPPLARAGDGDHADHGRPGLAEQARAQAPAVDPG